MKFFIAEVLIILVMAGAYFFLFRKKINPRFMAAAFGLFIVLGLIGGAVVPVIPVPTEPVTLTALNELNENSTSTQVALRGINVDGKDYELKNATEGKWFWRGNDYYWRSDSDTRRPDGLTQTIVIDVPIGNERTLIFDAWTNRGIVKVESGSKTEIVDTYGKSLAEVKLESSDSLKVIIFKLAKLAIFALIVAVPMVMLTFILQKLGEEKVKAWLLKYWDKLFYITTAVLYIIVLQAQSKDGSLWSDEIWSLSWIMGEDPNKSYLVFGIINKLWYAITPYGQEYLRLLSQLYVAGAIYFAGLIGAEFSSKRFGVLLSSSVAFSLTIANQCAMEIRPYAMLLFVTSMTLYAYIKKQKELGNEKIGTLIFYGVALALSMDTHQFGLLVAGMLMATDLLLIIIRKASVKGWIEFIIPGAYGIYWVAVALMSMSGMFNNYSWAGTPSIHRLIDAIRWLFSYNDVMLAFAALGLIVITGKVVGNILKKKFDFQKDFTVSVIALVPIGLVFAAYFYSTVVNPGNSLFIDRYFIAAIIFMLFVMCCGIDSAIDYIVKNRSSKKAEAGIVTLIVGLSCLFCWPEIGPWDPWAASYRTRNHDFKAVAEYVMNQKDAYSDSTLFIVDHGRTEASNGMSYYFTHKGERDDINHCDLGHIPNLDDYSTLYISNVYKGARSKSKLNKILDSQFVLEGDNMNAIVLKYVRVT